MKYITRFIKCLLLVTSLILPFKNINDDSYSYYESQKIVDKSLEIIEKSDYNQIFKKDDANSLEIDTTVTIKDQNTTFNIESIFENITYSEKNALEQIKFTNSEFSKGFDILISKINLITLDDINNQEIVNTENVSNNVLSLTNKKSIVITTGTFAVINSMFAGINAASFVPYVGWTVAGVLLASLVIYVVVKWDEVKQGFNDFVESVKRTYSRISNLINSAKKEIKDKAEEKEKKPDVAPNRTNPGHLKDLVEKGQAPEEIESVHNANNRDHSKPHIHFKDGTSVNWDGTIHDRKHGIPRPSKRTLKWIQSHGWCQNGIKYN